ncbi:MAG TPA: lipopolysaccharide assembly protein LapA domain-containing protein [Jatrophihabitans sp.]|nr:lipopolysaccharide assembly protein LapA domain-containing protein [Jatrophihabitans sp.]
MTDPVNQGPYPPPATSPITESIAPATEGSTIADPAAPVTSATSTEVTPPAPGFDHRGRVRSSRVSGVWIGLIGTALFLILLIIFIAQNSHRVSVHFFGWYGRFSLALTILLSAVIGLLLVAIPGTVRIVQLRHALRKNGPRTG